MTDWQLSLLGLISDAGQHPLPVMAYIIHTVGNSVTMWRSRPCPTYFSVLGICVPHCLLGWLLMQAWIFGTSSLPPKAQVAMAVHLGISRV